MPEENNGFGPIPVPRGNQAGAFHCAMLAGWLGCIWCIQPSPGKKSANDTDVETAVFIQRVFITSALAVTIVVAVILHSIGLYMEERKHINSRHGDRYQAFQRCLHFPMKGAPPVLLGLFAFVLFVLWFIKTEMFAQLFSQYWDLLLMLTGVQLFVLCFMKPAEVEVMGQVEDSKQNVAHGLAWSFYTGYLKIVLPGLPERIEESAWKTKIHSSARRLLVLIPLKCEVREKLEDEDSCIKNVTAGLSNDKCLQPVKKDRAGIKDRVYKNDVHCITDPDTGLSEYCVVEYATNVQTLYDMQHAAACEGFSREAREQQVKLLYCTLKNIIDDDPECRDRVVLVPLDITDSKDHTLARVILRTLKQLKSGTVDMPPDIPDLSRSKQLTSRTADMPDTQRLPTEETVPKVAIENSDYTPMQENSGPKGRGPCQDSRDPPTSPDKIEKESAGYCLQETKKKPSQVRPI